MHRRAAFRSALTLVTALLVCVASPSTGRADPALRKQIDLHGNFVLFGSNLTQDCASGVPAPTVGTIGSCPDNNLAAPDVYWRSDDPSMGMARADANISSADARATAMLVLPTAAQITYARLYWGGLLTMNTPDMQCQLQRVEDGLDQMISADDSSSLAQTGTNFFYYQSTADVTDIVQKHGAGPYRIAGVDSTLNNAQTGAVAAWYMVVFYKLDGEPSRNLAIFDGLDYVDLTTQANATLSGFVVPAVGFDAALGVVAFEGEDQFTGDALSFNGTALSDALNPSDNFFNATRSRFGTAVSNAGDLPQLPGTPGGYSNVDMDIVDVTSRVSGGNTSATIAASSTLDIYVLSAFVTSISTLAPDFTLTTKEVMDVNGGMAVPGDVLEYRITTLNQGSDDAVGVTFHDALPAGVSYVPGSLSIQSGANSGTKTDASGDDQAEYDDAKRAIDVRVGTGATSSAGGKVAIGESTEIRFRVTIDAGTRGDIVNQGVVSAAGDRGSARADTETDSDTTVAGQTPTTITVVECQEDAQCHAPTPVCDTTASPPMCVGCMKDAQCSDPKAPNCDATSGMCVCAAGPGMCMDSDGDGLDDTTEMKIGTDPHDADSDDDGVPDGAEPMFDKDTDGDGLINALDPDSDNDGLPDGTELGLGCNGAGTDVSRGHCTPDADMGATKTDPLARDTDNGSVSDGVEDANHNGAIDPGETDPTAGHGADDVPPKCKADSDCGDTHSGLVCMNGMCMPGCRGRDGNGCPGTQVCTSTTGDVGMCATKPKPAPVTPHFGGGGCKCGVSAFERGELSNLLLVALGLLYALRRRRSR
jgi:uncharacterized repeat protein (TIGR01451 family)